MSYPFSLSLVRSRNSTDLEGEFSASSPDGSAFPLLFAFFFLFLLLLLFFRFFCGAFFCGHSLVIRWVLCMHGRLEE